jgi:hypothetical protein
MFALVTGQGWVYSTCRVTKSIIAYLGYLYRIPDPDFFPSRISDPITTKKEWGKLVVLLFFVATNFTKLKLFDLLNMYRKEMIHLIDLT